MNHSPLINRIHVTPIVGADLIGHDTEIMGHVYRRVASLQDQVVRDQLIKAGWTPPRHTDTSQSGKSDYATFKALPAEVRDQLGFEWWTLLQRDLIAPAGGFDASHRFDKL